MKDVRFLARSGTVLLFPLLIGCSRGSHYDAIVDSADLAVPLGDMLYHPPDKTLEDHPSQPPFQAPKFYPVRRPWSIATGNFDGDQNLDLVVTTQNRADAAVLLGDGLGGLSAATYFPVDDYPIYPITVAVTDFNLDKKLDLAIAHRGGVTENGALSVLLGDGGGGFGKPTYFPIGGYPDTVAVGDFNLDSNPDVALTDACIPCRVVVLLGDGRGKFATPKEIPIEGTTHVGMAVADFDMDTNPDLVVGGKDVSVLLGDGRGGFGKTNKTGIAGYATAVGDFNLDGNPDIATEQPNVLLGDGRGGFSSVTGLDPISSAIYGVAVGDFNGDRNPDVAISSLYGSGPNIYVMLGNGRGTFEKAVTLKVGNNAHYLAAGDFNGDHVSDLAVSDWTSDKVAILLGVIRTPVP